MVGDADRAAGGLGEHAPSRWSQLAWWLSWATLAGAALQVATQLPEVWRLVGPLRPTLSRGHRGARSDAAQRVPVVGALGVVQLSGFADGFIASFLPSGSVSVLGLRQPADAAAGRPLRHLGVGVIAAGAVARSQRTRRGGDHGAPQRVQAGWLRILFYVVPSAVVFVLFGDLLVGMVLRSGQFGLTEQRLVHGDAGGVRRRAGRFSSNRLFAAVFHAMQDYQTPLRWRW